jgi:hypothetical protein
VGEYGNDQLIHNPTPDVSKFPVPRGLIERCGVPAGAFWDEWMDKQGFERLFLLHASLYPSFFSSPF